MKKLDGGGPRVVLDARPLSHPQAGGFRTYVRALLHGLRERDLAGVGDEKLILYLDRPISAETDLPRGAETRIMGADRLRADWLSFSRQVRSDAPDLIHGTTNYLPLGSHAGAAATTLTLHDAMGIRPYPWDRNVRRTPRERFVNRYWAFLTRASAQRARLLITVSRAARDELADVLGFPSNRFRVVYNGLIVPAPRVARHQAANTLLLIESPDPRKNVDAVYRALREGRDRFDAAPPCVTVVCNGARAYERACAARGGLAGAGYGVELLRDLSDQALGEAYARSAVFAWPSRWEGFGLPPLEAMQNGCAVVSSPAPAMPEILGDVPIYADPSEPCGFADALAMLLKDRHEQERRAAQGYAHAATFTCRRMADETVAVWREALGA